MKDKAKHLVYPVAFVLIVAVSFVYKFFFKGDAAGLVKNASEISDTAITETEETAVETTEETSAVEYVSVYICGAVQSPGVYEIAKGSILNDVVVMAGGFSDGAAQNSINLVYVITENVSVYIPTEEDVDAAADGTIVRDPNTVGAWGGQGVATGSGGTETGGLVNINTASEDELKSLPGVGDVTAAAIVAYREEHGFATIEDIKNVSGIGDAKYEQIKDLICVD